MRWLARIHGSTVHARRVKQLAAAIAALLPEHAQVLDIGTGDGTVAGTVMRIRNGVTMCGTDVLVRSSAVIPVTPFDGRSLPWADASFDFALLVDVLHHAEDPHALLTEAARVSRHGVIIKDHYAENAIDRLTLAAMDWFGNAGYEVPNLYRYWSRSEWENSLRSAGLVTDADAGKVRLYRFPLGVIFGRGLHFVTRYRPVVSV